jgi:hypothetical protein
MLAVYARAGDIGAEAAGDGGDDGVGSTAVLDGPGGGYVESSLAEGLGVGADHEADLKGCGAAVWTGCLVDVEDVDPVGGACLVVV